jgi:UDPglucose 6-dehydrogenase
MKIAYAEMLAEVCEKLPGCDVDEVTKLVGMDSRIGQKYLKAGLSYGGPCFPRDNRAFSAIAGDAKVLSEATDDANLGHGYFIRDKVHSILGKVEGKTISILGLTYKPDTNIVDDSGSLYVTNLLSDAGAKIKWYDPSGIVKNDWFKAKSIEDCLKDSELAIIATPWKEFLDLMPDIFLENMKVPRILDCWRIYNPSLFEQAGVDYYCVGRYGY